MNRRDLILAVGAGALLPLASLHPVQAQSSGTVRGQVIDVDQSAGEITIRHGPIKKLGMDHRMTMVFHAQAAAMLRFQENMHLGEGLSLEQQPFASLGRPPPSDVGLPLRPSGARRSFLAKIRSAPEPASLLTSSIEVMP